MSARIYDRPDLDQRRGRLALYVTGALPNGKPGLAYEGRLQIHNAIGACTVEQIDGDTLPPGSSLYIDGDEVVVAWPAYTETSAPIFNGDFEQGDVGWLKGAGWTIENSGGGNDGFGAKVAVYRGQGESFLEAAAYFPAQLQGFAGKVNVQQGASSAGNVGAGIGVRYYDADHQLVATQLGRFIDSGSKGAWHWSEGDFSVPGAVAYLRPVVRGYRRRENKPLWVDDASWEYQAILGINAEATFNLSLRVRDSAGRSALWSGAVVVEDSFYVAFASDSSVSTAYGLRLYRVASSGVTSIDVPSLFYGVAATALAISPDRNYIAVGLAASPYIAVYEWTGTGLGNQISPPVSAPTSRVNDIKWSPSGSVIYASSSSSPYLYAWGWSDGFGTLYAAPTGIQPVNQAGRGIAVSPEGDYVILATTVSPDGAGGFTVYWPWGDATGFGAITVDSKRSSYIAGQDVAFSPAGTEVIRVASKTGGVYGSTWDDGYGSDFTNPTSSWNMYSVKFTADGGHVLIGSNYNNSQFGGPVGAYEWSSAGFGNFVGAAGSPTSGYCSSISFSADGAVVAAAFTGYPYIGVWKWDGSFGDAYSIGTPSSVNTGGVHKVLVL